MYVHRQKWSKPNEVVRVNLIFVQFESISIHIMFLFKDPGEQILRLLIELNCKIEMDALDDEFLTPV